MNFVNQLILHEGSHKSLDDRLRYYKALLSYPYWNRARQLITYTRHYEQGLLFVEHMMTLLNTYERKLTEGEYEAIDTNLVFFYLELLDKSDRWMRYVEYYNHVRSEKQYVLTYSSTVPASIFGDFLVESDDATHYIHFLYSINDRYETVKRKIERLKTGKRTNHLKHHPQSELSDEEIARRFDYILSLRRED
ncbi:hypothetical protein [Brevibacillus sp. MER 51]|uniref:hypothetical protein n=1 Tax=Brevibacillus sp. MER 51 TaxID=2939560 RepID=UPI00203A870A|nr:hypothetical protein [Brevibacillus sp. MER 51]MCM3144374.1 hypothetical protein [Brevibacillus sp. MER 51]